MKAVADFQAVDGDVTLPALLAYLTAEDDQGNGLDIATPTEADSVKPADRAPLQGPGVGHGLLRRGVRVALPLRAGAHAVGLLAGRAAGRAPRRRRRPASGCRASTRRRSTTTAPGPRRTRPTRSSGWATSPSPAPRTGSP
ncbi:hypothetical protein [Nocardioides convexus]|uniref:hypothetical protein n=1 Tax=Nocardioides convexus TaxID=2712224 RepID=UPI00241839B2|nr:hypothetical protein [Nocardioides convexus]